MNDLITKVKRCSKKENCIHPAQVLDGWLPMTKDYFYLRKDSKTGYASQCKQCESKRKQIDYESNKDPILARNAEWTKNNPVKKKEINKKYRKLHPEIFRNAKKRWCENNKDRVREKDREWKTNHQDKARAWVQNWRDKNPEKAKQATRNWAINNHDKIKVSRRNRKQRMRNIQGTHTALDITHIFMTQNEKCYYCGNLLEPDYHVDHVIPVSRGGDNNPSNLVCACAKCNLSKKDKFLTEWIERISNPELKERIFLRIIERADHLL